jgi:phosphoglycolate phosphatase
LSGLAIFDLDGTLIDSLDDLAASVNHALAEVGLPPRRRDEIRSFVGEGARRLVERAVGARQDLVEPALAAWRVHYEAHCLDRTRPYPGIPEALAGARLPVAVLTNKPGPLARRILAGLGLDAGLVGVIGGDEAPRKPDPAGARALLARAGATAAESVLVGDSRVDAATARAAGLRFVGVTWGLGTREDLVAAGATVLLDDAAALAPHLK